MSSPLPRRASRQRVRKGLYEALDAWPRGYVAWRRRRHPDWPVVRPADDLVVEGYPASANSFLREVVREANPGIAVASHTHASAQVREGLRLGLPVVVLVRSPSEAVASIVVRRTNREAGDELARWARFHRRLLDILDEVVVAPFEVVVDRPADVVAAVNACFGTDLRLPTPDDVATAVARLTRYDRRVFGEEAATAGAMPDPGRAGRRDDLARSFASSELAERLATCDELHSRVLAHAMR